MQRSDDGTWLRKYASEERHHSDSMVYSNLEMPEIGYISLLGPAPPKKRKIFVVDLVCKLGIWLNSPLST